MNIDDKTLDKSPFQSKKFVFASVWNCIWLALIAYGIHQKIDPSVQIALVYSAALIQGLYLGGQSFVDAFVRAKFHSNGGSGQSKGQHQEVLEEPEHDMM